MDKARDRALPRRTRPIRCGHTARHLAALAQEVVETLEAVQADESLIEAYVQAAEHHASVVKRRE